MDRLLHPAPATLRPAVLRPLVEPAVVVRVSSPVNLRETESPSSIERLLGCSLSWALHYGARLESGLAVAPPSPGPLVFGKLAHRFLEQVLKEPVSPEKGAELAASVFEQHCVDYCEELGLPRHQADRATLKRAVVESARELMGLALKHGVRAARTEAPGKTTADSYI